MQKVKIYCITINNDHYDKIKKLEDTRIDKNPNFYMMKFNIKNCQKIEMKKKF